MPLAFIVLCMKAPIQIQKVVSHMITQSMSTATTQRPIPYLARCGVRRLVAGTMDAIRLSPFAARALYRAILNKGYRADTEDGGEFSLNHTTATHLHAFTFVPKDGMVIVRYYVSLNPCSFVHSSN